MQNCISIDAVEKAVFDFSCNICSNYTTTYQNNTVKM